MPEPECLMVIVQSKSNTTPFSPCSRSKATISSVEAAAIFKQLRRVCC